MRTKVTLTLLLLNVALFFWIFWYEGVRPDQTGPIGRAVIAPDATAVIDRLEIRRAGAAPIALELRPDGWFLGAPYDWPANRNAVEQIIDELRMLQHKTRFDVAKLEKTGQRLADFGLENPPLSLVFGHGGQTWELRVGTNTPDSSNLYLLPPPGTAIHVVDRGFVDVLPASADALRSDSLVEIPVWEARALVVQSARSADRVRVANFGDRWQLESPIEARANKAAVEQTVQQLGALRAATFVDPRAVDLRAAGLENPTYRISVEGNQRRQVLLLGALAPAAAAAPHTATEGATAYYGKLDARTDYFTVAVDNTLLATLGAAQAQLRDRHLLEVKPAQLRAVEIKAPGQPDLLLQRLETGTWQTLSRQGTELSKPQPADPAVVERLLAQLTKLESLEFHDDVPDAAELETWGFNLPTRVVTLTQSDGATAQLILGGPLTRDGRALRYARTAGAETVHLVSDEILRELPTSTLACRQRLLRELPTGARITGLALKSLGDDRTLWSGRLAGADDKWEVRLAPEPPRVREAATKLLDALRQLRAKEFSRDRFEQTFGVGPEQKPWTYELNATIELAAAGDSAAARTETTVLFFSERLGGTVMYAGSKEFECVFLVTQELLDAVFALAFGERDPGEPEPVGDNTPLDQRPAPPPAPPTTG